MPEVPYKAAKQQYPYRVTQKLRGEFAMGDQPTEVLEGWLGYFNYEDPTMLKPNVLTYPSVNCFIPFKDKIVPRLSEELLGVPFTQDKTWPIIGNMKKFSTMGGSEVEIRVTKTDDPINLKDIIEVLYLNPFTNAYQWFQITENVNPLPVGAHRYYFDQWFDTNLDSAESLNIPRAVWVNGLSSIFSWTGGIAPIVGVVPGVSISTTPGTTFASQGIIAPYSPATVNYSNLTGTFEINDIITGSLSGATGKVSIADPLSLIVINVTGTFEVGETVTGSLSSATGIVSSYFPPISVSTGNIVIKGTLYTVTSGWETDTLLMTDTGGISIGDIAFSQIKETSPLASVANPLTNVTFDVCKQNKNYMFYGSWQSRKLYMSNGSNKDATEIITASQAVQNDLVVGTSEFTGTGQHDYKVTIDSVHPDINATTYTGTSGLNDAVFNTNGYTALGNTENIYKVNVVADFTIIIPTPTHDFILGEVILGGTSKATARIVAIAVDGGNTEFGVAMIQGSFVQGETITGQGSGLTATIPSGSSSASPIFYQNWVQATKNGVSLTITSGPITGTTVPILGGTNPIITLSDGISVSFANYYGHAVGDVFELDIRLGGADTFQWQIDGATPIQTGVPILSGVGTLDYGTLVGTFDISEIVTGGTSGATGRIVTNSGSELKLTTVLGTFQVGETITGLISGATAVMTIYYFVGPIQTLENGVTIGFVAQTGHSLGDSWDITVTQAVNNGWANFYYTLPTRIPGEGYIYNLTSNFWTMAPQESEMYVNTQYGDWSYVDTTLSSNQQSETVSLTPLKEASALKVIQPYMIGYLDDDLLFVTTDKQMMMIGRKELIQLPHTTSLSQAVQNDFNNASFLNGSIEYQDMTLWITSPNEGVMFCYDNHPENKYWQPPQIIPENGILSVVNLFGIDTLITHSPLRNQSNTLFTGTSGDNGQNYTVRARTPYLSKGDRWGKKNANATFIDGYVSGNPPMNLNVYLGINGCGGKRPHLIAPVVCVSPTRAPHGEGYFGSHPNGSDTVSGASYFSEIYQQFKPILNYYFAALELECTATNHSYTWLTLGINSVINNTGNIALKNKEIISTT